MTPARDGVRRRRVHRAAVGTQVVLYAGVGVLKLVRTPQQLHDDLGFRWAATFPAWAVRGIAASELAAAAALALPPRSARRARLAELATYGLALLQAGAAVVDVRSGEPERLPVNAGLLGLAVLCGRTAPRPGLPR